MPRWLALTLTALGLGAVALRIAGELIAHDDDTAAFDALVDEGGFG
jgi:hypothetical protein